MTEWKPGDVAIVPGLGLAMVRLRKEAARSNAMEFAYALGGFDMTDDLADGYTARPLVVIDPEDREQMERLARAWDSATHATPGADPMSLGAYRMQAALRSLVAPPKPEEPTGLGAVVMDAEGFLWVRNETPGEPPWRCDHRGWQAWDRVTAVKVLSEGVTP